ncbi:MAG: flagellar motor switch protein FliN [Oscillospiraceae bacterium]|nr:flagellar motor switch protein FliN [Oscillospiraceae bacterium]
MSDEKLVDGFGEVEKDAIGEIMNITMGSAATAVSNLLSAKVWITTPTVTVISAKDLSFPELEPSIMVRIKYVQGVSGQNVLVLKQNDVQLILDQLMGLPLEVTDDFKFDEMNISAVCEVMNQMMGAAATALSEIIDTTVDISTPEAIVEDSEKLISDLYEVNGDENVVSIKFNLTIDGVINSEFISVLTIDLAKEMAEKMMAGYSAAADEAASASASASAADTPTEPASSGATLSQAEIEALLNGAGGAAAPTQQPAPTPQPMPQQPMQQAAPQQSVPQQTMPNGMPQQMPQGMPMQGMYGYDPNMQQYGMYGQMPQGQPMPNMYPQQPYGYPPQQPQPQMNIQPVQLQNFATYNNASLNKEQNDNLKLLMGVPLNVSVEIGSTTKKVKEILEFTQGTIIELERQAGAPVDIVVNGNLIAKGDVVVIDDNFAVRITEIIRSKFLDNLGKE